MASVAAELFYSGAWNNTPAYTRDGLRTTRGLAPESLEARPGTAALSLENRDGSKNPNNPVSPLYGLVGRNTPLRVTVDGNVRLSCEVADWALERTIEPVTANSGDAWVKVAGAGILRRLGRGQKAAKSSTYRIHTGNSPAPVGYWPFEDGAQSTQVASAIAGHPAAAVNGELKYATDTAVDGSDPLPKMTATSTVRGVVPPYTPPATQEWSVAWLMRIPAAPGATTKLITIDSPAGTVKRWTLELIPSGGTDTLKLSGFSGTGAELLGDPGLVFQLGPGQPEPYGRQILIWVQAFQNGTAIDWGYSYTLPDGPTSNSGSLPAAALNVVTGWEFTAQAGLADVTVGHVAAYTDTFSFLFTVQDLVTGHNGEPAGNRFARLCTEEGITGAVVGTASETHPMGPQPTAPIVDLLNECARTDSALMFETRASPGLTFRTGRDLQNTNPMLTLDYAARQVAPPLRPIIGDQGTRNDVVAKRRDGSSARVVLETGSMSVLAPPSGVGRYDTQLDVNPELDTRLIDHAGWHLHKWTVDETRYASVTVDLDANPELVAAVNTTDIGDRLAIDNLPPEDTPDLALLMVIAAEEVVRSTGGRLVTFATVPASPYEVGIVGANAGTTDLRGQAMDTDKSTLSANVAAAQPGTSMTLSVASTGGVLWTTDANDWDTTKHGTSLDGRAGLFIRIGGEDMRITNITGGASPQTFTVLRGQNGVVKAHASGAPVHVRYPAVVAL